MKGKLIWLDNIRVISTLAVVMLHVASPIIPKYGNIPDNIWMIGNIYNGAVRFCVPLFFMLSGALLLSKDYNLNSFLKKRFWRIIPPFIFWSLVYIIYDHVLNGKKSYTLIDFTKLVIRKIFNGSQHHLWFVYTLLGLYLFIPILRKWVKNSSNNEILYFLIIWLVTIIYSLQNYKLYLPKIPLTNFAGYIGYIVLGYYLSNFKIKNKYIPISMFLIGLIITIVGTYGITVSKNEFSEYFYKYLAPNVILSSAGMFLMLKNTSIKNKKTKQIICFFSDQSFGIYLLHLLILTILNFIGINWSFINPIIAIPITTIICFLLSSLTIHLLRKIKYGKYISG
ncbi:acyltransferase [Algibacter pectinivorans]|uniref:Surface polysaccharide O-acyltransferase, integral membrane enzyme n=1 Tax=Algibacter pectinivorans TaxID=870482 RepID=A0A1I1Q2B5_9FLAO|nr:acyltransferase family protein [Algibacter pectinivorans]SFD16179.1 Surface polysaccharide O-acyltransferase, integral membrane enzyme [Algibacter pectinivorans]